MWGDPEDQLGGKAFRDRFTDAVWQGPTWSFAILLLVLDLGSTSGGSRLLLVGGFALVMAVTLLALRAKWTRLPPWTQAVLPVGDILGASLMVLAVPATVAPPTLLLCSLPVIWLAFEFGAAGLAASIASVVVVAGAAYMLHGGGGRALPEPTTMLVPALFLIGIALVARLMSVILHNIAEVLQSRTDELAETLELAQSRLVVLNGVMDSIDAGVTVLRPDTPPMLNAQAATIVRRAGASPDQPERPGDRIYFDDGVTPVPPADQAVRRALAGEEFTGLVHWIGEPGDQRASVVSARQLRHPDGRLLGSVLASWDATELMTAIRTREEFVTTVSHELRTPLTAITASLELLTDLLDPAAVDADCVPLLASCVRNAALLGSRVADLLATTTALHGTPRSRATDVTALVHASLAKHGAALAAAGLSLHVEAEADVMADVDPVQFEQVVDNLVSNAVKYTAAGAVTVSLRSTDDALVLGVADTGQGMTREEQRRAFDRFYRAPGARSAETQGLGIGLGLVQSIVERHHGRTELTSAPGEGTTVSVTIPRSGGSTGE